MISRAIYTFTHFRSSGLRFQRWTYPDCRIREFPYNFTLKCGEISMDNKCDFLRLLISLDSKPTRLSELCITKISNVLLQYLIDISLIFEDDYLKATSAIIVKRRQYYLIPSFYLFHSSKKLANLVLYAMASWVSEVSSVFSALLFNSSIDRSTRVCVITSVLRHMYIDGKMRQILLSCSMQIETVLQNLLTLLLSEKTNRLDVRGKLKIQSAYDRLKAISGAMMWQDAHNFRAGSSFVYLYFRNEAQLGENWQMSPSHATWQIFEHRICKDAFPDQHPAPVVGSLGGSNDKVYACLAANSVYQQFFLALVDDPAPILSSWKHKVEAAKDITCCMKSVRGCVPRF